MLASSFQQGQRLVGCSFWDKRKFMGLSRYAFQSLQRTQWNRFASVSTQNQLQFGARSYSQISTSRPSYCGVVFGGHRWTLQSRTVNVIPAQNPLNGLQSASAATSSQQDESLPPGVNVEKMRRNTMLGGIAMGVSMLMSLLVAIDFFGAPLRDEDGIVIEDEYSDRTWLVQYVLRAYREGTLYISKIKEPSREKLLPDPLTAPYYQPKYTVVVEMSGVLVHPEWQLTTGWRFKKRPAVDFFIHQAGYPNFELVIYTQESGFTAFPIINGLDPEGLIMYRLFKDATLYRGGHHIKDLSKLNRDLSKVIMIDWDPHALSLNPDNALRLPRWEGDMDDTGLIELAALLKTIATSSVDDVRPTVQYYSQFDRPLEVFRENQNKLQAQTKKPSTEKEKSSLAKSYAGGLFGFGRHRSS